MPFSVHIEPVADPDLGPLLTYLADAGYPSPQVTPTMRSASASVPRTPLAATTPHDVGELPAEWRAARELQDQSYRWPELHEYYARYVVYATDTEREGTVHIALGDAPRFKTWGRDRKYVIAFLTSGAPQIPLCEFLEVDDYEESRELLAVIRGSDGGRRMYGPGDSLPDAYGELRTELYSDRIKQRGAWNKLAVVAHEDDVDTMLNHALLQARRRGDL